MAEALGLASSIVALVQLSASVYSVTSKFYRDAKDAKSKISALATQIRNLSGVLQSLSLLASAPLFDDAGTSSVDFRDTYIESCHRTLQKIKQKLEKAESDFESGSHRKLVTRSLKWPFAAQEIDEWIAELSRHEDVLQLALSANTMSQLLQCLANTRSTAKSIEHLSQKFDRKEAIDMRAELTKKREEIVRFFLKVNPEDNLEDCRKHRQPNTGRWLIERNEIFRDWLDSRGSQIWLSGIPGAGKTILCGTVIEEILQKQTHSTAVAFFFCDYKYAQSQEPVNVLGALAVQLAKQGDAAFGLLEAYYERLHPQNGISKPLETKTMIGVTQAMINEYDSVYLAIDGLDECGSSAVEVIQSLKSLAKGDQVTMALFSRNESEIADELSDSQRIEIAAHTEDIQLYVLAQMENRKRLGGLAVKNAELHKHILSTLIDGANGMFRWVACQLDHLDSLPSDGRRRKALTELPPTLFATYDRILDRIMQEDEHNQELCRKALHWIGLGYKHVSPRALCEAISIPEDEDVFDEEQLVEPEWVSRICSSLIRLSGQASDLPHFQFAHFTVKEYLRNIKPQSSRGLFQFAEDEAIRTLLETSLKFLTFANFDHAPTLASSEMQRIARRNQQHPFYPVAAGYTFFSGDEYLGTDESMGGDLASVVNDERMMKYVFMLFDPDKTALFLSWVLQAIWHWPGAGLNEADFSNVLGLILAPGFSTLHVAASLALPSICWHLLKTQKVDVNMSCRLGTPLHALLAGVSIYRLSGSADFTYMDSRHYRSYRGTTTTAYDKCRQCLETFVQHCADTSARWDNVNGFQLAINNARHVKIFWIEPLVTQSTVIDEACIRDFKAALSSKELDRSFIDAVFTLGSGPDVPSMWARLAFLIQTSRMDENDHEGDEMPIELQRNLSDEDFPDAVRISLDQNLTDALKSLVQDPRFRPDIYVPVDESLSEPVLHFAIRAGSVELLELLLDAGCDPKVVDEANGWTGLHQCAWSNTDDAANSMLLLRSGVADSIRNKEGETCWHIAAEEGNIPVLKALIELGPDTAKSLRTISNEGRTPLAHAILNAQTSSALLLLEHCSAEPEVFRSNKPLLDKAVAIGSEDLFPRLFEMMKQVWPKEALQGSKPLDHINMACSPKLVAYLLNIWGTDDKSKSDALANYLLDANNPKFEDPDMYPKHADLDHIIRRLLPPAAVIDDQSSSFDFWSTFCGKVLVNLTKLCDHKNNRCRSGLIKMILEILIEAGVLDTYERNAQLPSYRIFFQSLLARGEDLKCSWINPSVQRAIKASTLSKHLANDAASNELLSLAVQQSKIDLVKQLLNHRVDVHATHNVLSPIEQACYSSDLPTFELVIRDTDRSHINRAGTQGKTLLHWAVSGTVPGYLTKIQRLLKLGAHIDTKVDDSNADTALILASRDNREDVATLLVSEGADSMQRGRDGWSVLHAAASTGNLRYIQSLLPPDLSDPLWTGKSEYALVYYKMKPLSTPDTAAIHVAARTGRSNFLRFMAQKHIPFDVNAVTGHPYLTPLHVASIHGHLDFVELLISFKVNLNAKISSGLLAIDFAALGGHLGIVKMLLRSGSDKPSHIAGDSIASLISRDKACTEPGEDESAMSQFHFERAIAQADLNQCKRIVAAGQSINDELLTHSYTPLVRALFAEQTAIVDWLVSSDVEVKNPDIRSVHPSMRCIASLATHHIPSPSTLLALMSLALKQSVSWYGSILGPLHVAILDDKMEALEMILKHVRENDHAYREMIETELICAPDDIIDWRGRSALSILVSSFNRQEALSGNPPWKQTLPPGSPLHWAIRNSNNAAVRLLIKNEADINQADSLGKTPLQLAVSSDQPVELTEELLRAGAGSAEPSGCRIEAMELAIRNEDLGVVRTLAEVDPETLKGVDQYSADTLLQSATSAAILQYLVSRGADPFKARQAAVGDSAVAVLIGPDSCLSGFAINSGLVSQSSEDSLAFALVKVACEGGPENVYRVKMLRRILLNDVFTRTVNWKSRDIASPLCLAASFNAVGMVEALITMGAEPDLEGCRHGSPLMAACAWGNLDVARALVRAGALLCYVNGEGLLRSAVSSASRHQKVMKWLLVDRHVEQPKLDYHPSQSTSHATVWSGPRLFKLALPQYMHRDFGESSWSHLRRIQKWREGLRGSALAESRRNSGLDFDAGFAAESGKREAQAAHRRFLVSLGES